VSPTPAALGSADVLNGDDRVVFGNDNCGISPTFEIDAMTALCLEDGSLPKIESSRTVSRMILLAMAQNVLNSISGKASLLTSHHGVGREAKGDSGLYGNHRRAPFLTVGE
jgi:hypothetical protein